MNDKVVNFEDSTFSKSIPHYPVGSVIARRYTVIKSLGKGGAGSVYLCNELNNTDKLLAVKILSARLSDDPTLLARFYREGKISSQIVSQYVVRSYDLLMDDGLFAYTMEYIPGHDLGELLSLDPQPDTDFIYSVLYDIAQGLTEIHKHKVIHRDLKPSNVIVNKDLRSKITDFGVVQLAKELHAKQEESPKSEMYGNAIEQDKIPKNDKLTLIGDFIGTIDYISPEYASYAVSDERSDIYSLGVIAYKMFTGRVPFEGDDMNQKIKARIERAAPNITEFRGDIAAPISNLIMGCLEKLPRNRPQTAQEVALVLARTK